MVIYLVVICVSVFEILSVLTHSAINNALQILSDSERRAHYDSYLLSQRKIMQKHSGQGSTLYTYKSQMTTSKEMEVVEWLKWYRLAINDILAERKVVVGTGYFDVLEADFYSAIHAAYYGPVIESMDLLPDRFEAEERSAYETPEVLHLVSGRDLFGMVCLVNKIPRLSAACTKKLDCFTSVGLGICRSIENAGIFVNSNVVDIVGISQMHSRNIVSHTSDAYKDLELHVSGRVVAVATRIPPKNQYDGGVQNEDDQDQIHVFLSSDDNSMRVSKGLPEDSFLPGAVGARIPLGTIMGLGTRPEEGSCFVYDRSGAKTHVIMKHRTLLVRNGLLLFLCFFVGLLFLYFCWIIHVLFAVVLYGIIQRITGFYLIEWLSCLVYASD